MKKILFVILAFLVSSGAYAQALKIGDEVHGGIVAYIDESGDHGLVCSLEDLVWGEWEEAKEACAEYSFMGKNDWYLPSKDELNLLYVNLHKKGLGDFTNNNYWSSTEYNIDLAWRQLFANGNQNYYSKSSLKYIVRAVRAF